MFWEVGYGAVGAGEDDVQHVVVDVQGVVGVVEQHVGAGSVCVGVGVVVVVVVVGVSVDTVCLDRHSCEGSETGLFSSRVTDLEFVQLVL